MAKEPSIRFPYQRFITETALMSDHVCRAYLQTICFVARAKYLDKDRMDSICKSIPEKDVHDFLSLLEVTAYGYTVSWVLSQVEHREKVSPKPSKEIPTIEEVLAYCKEFVPGKMEAYIEPITLKYDTWVENGWRDGFGAPILNWKMKFKTMMKNNYIKPVFKPFDPTTPSIPNGISEKLSKLPENWQTTRQK